MPEKDAEALLSLSSLLERGGGIIYILLGLSVIALALMILKAIQLLRAHFSENHRPSARLQATLQELRNPAPAPDALENAARFHAAREMAHLESGLRWLEATAALAPLLGLLGTVMGMIRAFRDLESSGAMNDPVLLSGGIWEALLTTAAGLSIAVPVLAALAIFESQIEAHRRAMEETARGLLERSEGGGEE